MIRHAFGARHVVRLISVSLLLAYGVLAVAHAPVATATDTPCSTCIVRSDPNDGAVKGAGTESAPPSQGVGGGSGSCDGCKYLWILACPGNSVGTDGNGNFVDPVNEPCSQPASMCPPGEMLENLYILRPPDQISTGGTRCVGGDPPPTDQQVAQAASDAFSQLLTTAEPTHQPDPTAIVNIPTLFATNIPQRQIFTETLLDQTITLQVDATWVWDFGDGATLTTTNPGGRYPNTSLAHTYVQAGKYTVTVTTNWTGSYSINGGPPRPIPGGPIPRRSTPFLVDVHEAHAVLVND